MSAQETEQDRGPWVGYEGAAEHTNLSETYLRQLVMKGPSAIPFKRIGRRVLFSIPALDRWVSNNGAAVPETVAAVG